MLSSFPHLSDSDFNQACTFLLERFRKCEQKQDEWTSVEMIHQHDMKYLRIIRALPCTFNVPTHRQGNDGMDELDDDDDEEVILKSPVFQAVINYDILLSPTYRVPVLYISISDPQHRFSPTMTTLYEHLIPPHFKPQTENVGIIGAITVTVSYTLDRRRFEVDEIQEHPATNRPVFFIHPCQTAEVMEATVGDGAATAGAYMMVWIGALGKYVGLNVPLTLIRVHDDD